MKTQCAFFNWKLGLSSLLRKHVKETDHFGLAFFVLQNLCPQIWKMLMHFGMNAINYIIIYLLKKFFKENEKSLFSVHCEHKNTWEEMTQHNTTQHQQIDKDDCQTTKRSHFINEFKIFECAYKYMCHALSQRTSQS